MRVHGTMPELIKYIKAKDDSISKEEAGLVAYFLIKKEYDLTSENAEVNIDLDTQWFLNGTQSIAKTPTGRYKYSISINDLYLGIFTILAKAIFKALIQFNSKVDISIIPQIGWETLDLLRKLIYKVKDDERCVYIYICEHEEVTKDQIVLNFLEKECTYPSNKNYCKMCEFKHSSEPVCKMSEFKVEEILTRLVKLNVIKADDMQKYSCVF